MKSVTAFFAMAIISGSLAATTLENNQPGWQQSESQQLDISSEKSCDKGDLKVAGKCHERAEPCLTDSECCSKKCNGSCE
jgi:hypothetical protein